MATNAAVRPRSAARANQLAVGQDRFDAAEIPKVIAVVGLAHAALPHAQRNGSAIDDLHVARVDSVRKSRVSLEARALRRAARAHQASSARQKASAMSSEKTICTP